MYYKVCLSMIDDARVQYVYVGCSAMNNVSSDGNHKNDNNTTKSSSLLLLLLHSDQLFTLSNRVQRTFSYSCTSTILLIDSC